MKPGVLLPAWPAVLLAALSTVVPSARAAAQQGGVPRTVARADSLPDVRAEAQRVLAHADSLFRAGDSAAARVAYEQVIRLDSTSSRPFYQLARLLPAGSHEQLRLLWRYTELEPRDAWGFGALGEALADAGEIAEARAAYRAALELEPAPEFRDGLRRLGGAAAGGRAALGIEPIVRRTADSDGELARRTGAALTLALSPALRFGLEAATLSVSDGYSRTSGWQSALSGQWRASRPLLLAAQAGFTRIRGGERSTTEPTLQARMRWRPASGPSFEVRARREPLTATPQLLRTPVVLSELRGTVELPVFSVLYARGIGRMGTLEDGADPNRRRMLGGGPVLRLTPLLEVNALLGRTSYDHPTAAGYFAPERIDVRDAGCYWELERWPFTLAVDAGGGLERITRFHEPAGGWRPAWHAWSQAGWSLSDAAELRLEAEYYRTQAGEAVAAGGSGWSWNAVALGLRLTPGMLF